jgi:hypothetical protein
MSLDEVVKKYQQLKPEAQKEIDLLLEKLASQEDKATAQTPISLLGILKGKITMADDFDEPLDDFKDYM